MGVRDYCVNEGSQGEWSKPVSGIFICDENHKMQGQGDRAVGPEYTGWRDGTEVECLLPALAEDLCLIPSTRVLVSSQPIHCSSSVCDFISHPRHCILC